LAVSAGKQQIGDTHRQSLAPRLALRSNSHMKCRQVQRWSTTIAGMAATAVLLAPATHALAQTCARADFEAVVGAASTTLRDMTARNTPVFQEKLRLLKDKRGWNYEQLVKEAAPLVADERIAEFDAKSIEFLGKINTMGGEGASGTKPDCKLLGALKANMSALVETQTEKWTYMFGKLEAEMAK
jgi:hypothetical protein